MRPMNNSTHKDIIELGKSKHTTNKLEAAQLVNALSMQKNAETIRKISESSWDLKTDPRMTA